MDREEGSGVRQSVAGVVGGGGMSTKVEAVPRSDWFFPADPLLTYWACCGSLR